MLYYILVEGEKLVDFKIINLVCYIMYMYFIYMYIFKVINWGYDRWYNYFKVIF